MEEKINIAEILKVIVVPDTLISSVVDLFVQMVRI